jgi:hypothetical protein
VNAVELRRAMILGLSACALCVATGEVWGQVARDEPARRRLIAEAVAARDAGDHARAVSLATEAAVMHETPTLRRFIAEERQAQGQVIEALRDARACVRELEADPSVARYAEHLDACAGIVRALGPRVGRVTVRVDTTLAGLEVQLGGRPLARDACNAPYEVLIGPVVITATADGRRPFSREVTVAPGAPVEVVVSFDPVVDARVVIGHTTPPVASRGASVGPWVMLGVGALSFAAAGVFYAQREDALGERDALCSMRVGTTCTVSRAARGNPAQLEDDADSWNTATNAALVTGAALAAGAVVWWVVARVRASRERAMSVMVTPRAEGLALGLRWTM